MANTFVGAVAQRDAGNGNCVITKPAGVQSGDYMIVGLQSYAGSPYNTVSVPSGWSLYATDDFNTEMQTTTRWYTKVAGGSEPSTYTWNISNGSGSFPSDILANMVVLRGASTALQSSAVSTPSGTEVDPVSATAPSLTVTGTVSLVCIYFSQSNTSSGPTNRQWTSTPSGMSNTGAVTTGGTNTHTYSAYLLSTTTPTGGRTATLDDIGSSGNGSSLFGRSFAITADTPPTAPSLVSPAANAPVALNTTNFQWTHNDIDGDAQVSYALRRRAYGSGTYEWWNGTTWVTSETFVSTATQNVTPTGFTNTDDTYYWSVATKSFDGASSGYATERIVNPWEWWNGTNWVYSTEAFITSANSDTTIAAAQFANGDYKWSVATKDSLGAQGPYSSPTRFTFGSGQNIERFGNFI